MSGEDFIKINTPIQVLSGIGFPFGDLNQKTGGKQVKGVQVTSQYGEVSTVDIQLEDKTILRYEWTGTKYAERETQNDKKEENLETKIREEERRVTGRSSGS